MRREALRAEQKRCWVFRTATPQVASPATDVDSGPACGIGFVLAKDFAHDGCGVALAEEEVAEEVSEGVAL